MGGRVGRGGPLVGCKVRVRESVGLRVRVRIRVRVSMRNSQSRGLVFIFDD